MNSHTDVLHALYNRVAQQHLPHALLLSGEAGTPLLSIARDLITYIHCTQRKQHQACQQCPGCTKATKLLHPDLHCVIPMGNNAKQKKQRPYADNVHAWKTFVHDNECPLLQDWRECLANKSPHLAISKDQIHYVRAIINKKAFESQHKTILVWLPDVLHPVAANAMLKMVEEPSPNTFFICITHQPHRILPTMRSRLWTIKVPSLTKQAMTDWLSHRYPTIEKARIEAVAHIAQGNANLAQKLLIEEEKSYVDEFIQWMRKTYTHQLDALIKLADDFHAYSLPLQQYWLLYALRLLRNVLSLQAGLQLHDALTTPERSFCRKFAQTISFEQLTVLVKHVSCLYDVITKNAQPKLAFLCTSLAISTLFGANKKRQNDPYPHA